MTLDQLRYALELQKHRNFSRAAEACRIAQPSLSVQISKLEEELGVVLFDRARTGVETTEYGAEILQQARVILDEAERMGQIVLDLKGEISGRFRLGVIPTLAPSVIPLFLAHFGERYPKVELSIVEETTERLVQRIDEGSLDGALLSTPPRCPESLIEKVLFYEPFVIFASIGHPILANKKMSPSMISNSEILLLNETHCLRDQVLQLCRSKSDSTGTKESSRKFKIESGSLQTLIEVLRKDEGYTLLPALSEKFLTTGERAKNIREFDKPTPVRKISLVFHKAHLKRSIIEALKTSIVESLPDTVHKPASGQTLKVLAPQSEHFEV